MYYLCALFFAFEDRKQIAKLIVETLNRLSVATGVESSAKDLRHNISNFMRDGVTKNLGVETLVSELLGTSYVPMHTLCKSHTCEKLDECCIDALVETEIIIHDRKETTTIKVISSSKRMYHNYCNESISEVSCKGRKWETSSFIKRV